MIEIKIDSDKFSVIKETLTRIGIAKFSSKELYQSAHILAYKGKYFIAHFKELFEVLDGKSSRTLTKEDLIRRDVIAWLLQEWGLIRIVNPERDFESTAEERSNKKLAPLYVVRFSEKGDSGWKLISKWSFRPRRPRNNTQTDQPHIP